MARTAKGKVTTGNGKATRKTAAAGKRGRTAKATDVAPRATRRKAAGAAAPARGESVIFNAPILASTRSGLTKLKGILHKSSQGKVIDALVKDALKRAREAAR